MSIYAISDLHLSFNTDKPMDIFGWQNYEEEIKKNWLENVTDNDLVILSGDFSWEMKLENTYKDFQFINNLPGKKLLIKGNHDYWWNTVSSMRKFLKDNQIANVDFIYNNAYEYDNTIIAGTRGWLLYDTEKDDEKRRNRELLRLEASIKYGIEKYGENKPILVCLHYPPITANNHNSIFSEVLNRYKVKECIYGHLHGKSQEEAIEGIINDIKYTMVSCDYTHFKLVKIS